MCRRVIRGGGSKLGIERTNVVGLATMADKRSPFAAAILSGEAKVTLDSLEPRLSVVRPRFSIHSILGWRGNAEVRSGVIESIPILVIDMDRAFGDAENEAMKANSQLSVAMPNSADAIHKTLPCWLCAPLLG